MVRLSREKKKKRDSIVFQLSAQVLTVQGFLFCHRPLPPGAPCGALYSKYTAYTSAYYHSFHTNSPQIFLDILHAISSARTPPTYSPQRQGHHPHQYCQLQEVF